VPEVHYCPRAEPYDVRNHRALTSRQAHDRIAETLGWRALTLRALLQPALESAGLTLCSWTRRAFDTVRRDPEAIAAALTRDLTAGDVLVLHDGAAHERAGRAEILLRALPIVLGSIRERGLAVVPVTG